MTVGTVFNLVFSMGRTSLLDAFSISVYAAAFHDVADLSMTLDRLCRYCVMAAWRFWFWRTVLSQQELCKSIDVCATHSHFPVRFWRTTVDVITIL
jgi:hypothetical protein